jgi:hypothetical protein
MNISPIHCPESDCFWAAHGIPDQYTEARDWHLAAHRAEEHGEPLTEEQLAYATRAGHVIPGSVRTLPAAVAALGALAVPVGDQPQPLTDARLAEIAERTPKRAAALTAWIDKFSPLDGQRDLENAETVLEEDVPALLAEVQRLKAERHSTNEALDDAVKALRDMRDRSVDLEVIPAQSYTLAPWLYWRFGSNDQRWDDLADDDKSYWEHHARAVRRAVVRGGFKAGEHESTAEQSAGMHPAIRTINSAEEA